MKTYRNKKVSITSSVLLWRCLSYMDTFWFTNFFIDTLWENWFESVKTKNHLTSLFFSEGLLLWSINYDCDFADRLDTNWVIKWIVGWFHYYLYIRTLPNKNNDISSEQAKNLNMILKICYSQCKSILSLKFEIDLLLGMCNQNHKSSSRSLTQLR